jgi:superfamily II RNA helicase
MPRRHVNKRRERQGAKKDGRERTDAGRAKDKGRGQERSRNDSDAQRTASSSARSHAPTRELRRLLEGIGTPEPAPFKPDPFQLEALSALEHEDVLVTAPTGSGKTWIAREEIRRLLAAGKRAWYTSPLKALTNSKYQEFTEEFGEQRVGILTGDRKENADAPLVVGTTEIYRNQLFDALRSGRNINADLVVLDEAHYLADEERGHVWEEAIILSPPRVRLLLLSATIGNAPEFASWIAEVRGVHCGVVERPGARPVPLRAAFLYPEGQLIPLLNNAGDLHPEIVHLGEQQERQRQERSPRGDWRSRRGGFR